MHGYKKFTIAVGGIAILGGLGIVSALKGDASTANSCAVAIGIAMAAYFPSQAISDPKKVKQLIEASTVPPASK